MKRNALNSNIDLLAEVFAANLIDSGNELERIVLRPRSLFKRNYNKDILRVDKQFKIGKLKFILLEIAREGIFDSLPEGLFHSARSIIGRKDLKKKLESIKKRKEEEKNARAFFLAFEREFYRTRILIELKERIEIAGFSEQWLSPSFMKFWGIDLDWIDKRKAAFLLYLLPLASRITSSYEILAKCIQILLNIGAKFGESSPASIPVPGEFTPILGGTRLGEDFVLGNSLCDGTSSLTLRLGPVKNEQILDLLPQGSATKLLKILFDYFLPFHWDPELDIVIDSESSRFKLSEKAYSARLGYTTII